MKQSRVIQIVIIAANLVLAVICIAAFSREDKVKPEFMFQPSDYIYRESGQTDTFLRDIEARDDRDGYITDRIVVEKLTENRENSTVIVYYAVSDSAGNVAKTSRVFPAAFTETEQEKAVETFVIAESLKVETLEDQTAEPRTNEGDDGEAGGQPEEDENQEEAEEEEAEEEPDNDQREADREETDRQDREDESEERGDEAEEVEQSSATQQPAQPVRKNSGAPVLTLKKAEVTIEAGTNPPWTEIIETLQDDKDDYATLYYNLNVSRFNRSQPGDYPVTLYTEDSDGNRSGTVTVMVHVKGKG